MFVEHQSTSGTKI